MKLMQCWDDGVTSDVRLVSLLRRYGAHATFNLNAGLHARERQFGWHHQGTEVWRLGRDELRQVYAGFNVANHSLTHPHPEQLPIESARREIQEGRAHLQDLFDQPGPAMSIWRPVVRRSDSRRPQAGAPTGQPNRSEACPTSTVS
jgi:peptidoglycan/xylan/chitin deacetylase (PgdA/CDA1 family)